MRGIITFLAIGILAAGAGHVAAQDCSMIVLFADDGQLVDQIVTESGLIDAHLVLSSDVDAVSTFEAALEFSTSSLLILAINGPNGFTNFGSPQEIVAGYTTPLPVQGQAILVYRSVIRRRGRHRPFLPGVVLGNQSGGRQRGRDLRRHQAAVRMT